jgi:L-asparaginase II
MSQPPALYEPVIVFTRGRIVESFHNGAIAVVDTEGHLVASYGDPHAVTYLRSSAKPFQTLPLVESGAAEKFGLTPRELAITCASHLGLDMHVETVSALQQKIGVGESDLLCGTHPLSDPATAARLIREGQAPTPLRHNCSGKHTGMLAQAKFRGAPIADYINPLHPVQQTILQTFAEMCDLEPQEVVIGIDGCSVPTFAAPLVNTALAFARLADPGRLPAARAAALRTIFAAMTTNPEMVRGPGEFDTEVMRLCAGKVVSKSGAEAFVGMGLTPGAAGVISAGGAGSPALGVAIKIGDGGSRADMLVGTEVLRQLGVLDKGQLSRLTELGLGPTRRLRNFRGLEVGEARPCFELKFV